MKSINQPHAITFYAPKYSLRWFVQLITGGACHMGLVDGDTVIQAGVVVYGDKIKHFCEKHKYASYKLWHRSIPTYKHSIAVRNMRNLIGTPYDVLKFWYVVKFVALGLIGKKPKIKYDLDGAVMCQEAFQESVVKANCPIDKDWLFPAHFEKSGYFTMVKEVIL